MDLSVATNNQKNGGEEMGTLQRNLSLSGWAALGTLAIALLGLLAVQGCTPSAQDISNGQQEATGAIEVNEGELVPAPKVGRRAPDFTLADLEDNQVSLSDFRGKTVFLNFWATWCPPCRAEMPEIEAVYQKYRDKNVVVIGVDLFESEDKISQFVQQGGYSWTFAIDSMGEVSKNYRVAAIPASFFIDREGIIRAVNIGPMTMRAMEAKLAEAMK
ncbi:peroxiredoxin family protein [Chloroflexota bacterium]